MIAEGELQHALLQNTCLGSFDWTSRARRAVEAGDSGGF
jgi:hypothetical protein